MNCSTGIEQDYTGLLRYLQIYLFENPFFEAQYIWATKRGSMRWVGEHWLHGCHIGWALASGLNNYPHIRGIGKKGLSGLFNFAVEFHRTSSGNRSCCLLLLIVEHKTNKEN